MALIFLVVWIYGAVHFSAASEQTDLEQFHSFINEYDKAYTAQEYRLKSEIFRRNLELYNDWNRREQEKGGTAQYGIDFNSSFSQDD